ncbi:cadmium-translocating P-type ATPase [Mucilaginibacter rubeus]|uniref:P-type Zn(2+) transporter n=2 Tax=Mucilaginibacter rubeus TaxID=2027860 RepID=A0A364WWF7_9SPHI|nr:MULTISPECIES: heavy metal translocating P-type ATPase [Mucilaginibacter]QEM06162.1 cadmium-translocating P-type ATPase [Mucilaginibacter rubeus]QEM13679.1 cadmium-translocating P-type ATPase [Mucilaginibacter rubeus]QEM18744.1 cadmium-translocating P-type ATPase [Mucilaginibacter gossypii]QTE36262.1 heavy metal translocating P-type ATPase [Mucilaginibacter gossypii]QTE44715.1 cadmium-translocating P-type ATPase [Mucilaginibacter rubeus]
MKKQESKNAASHKGHKHEHPRVDISRPGDKEEKKGHDHDEEGHEQEEGHDHEHGGIFGKNTELIFAILCGVALGAGWGLHFVKSLPEWASLSCYIIAYFFGGYFTAKEAVETVLKGGFEIDFLMLVAAVGAAILGSWLEGALLLFLFSLGHSLEHYAMGKARKSIEALTSLAPPTAHVIRDGKQTEVRIEELKLGEVIVIKPNSKIPADGVVVKGEGSVNQAPITGESVPVEKRPVADIDKDYSAEKTIKPEHRVFAGTINGGSALEVKVIREAKDSTISRLVKMVNEAEKQKSPTQLFTDKFEKYFVPAVLVLVTALCFAFLVIDEPFSKSFYRAMSVLVAASPCALAISTPSAVLSGVARAARGGVLIKGGRPLEDLGELQAIAFDKTGTLTEGKPKLTQVIPFEGTTEEELLETAIAVEKLSDHPLAEAIVVGGLERLKRNHKIPEAGSVKGIVGKGVQAKIGSREILIGNLALFGKTLPDELKKQVEELEKGGNTTMTVKSGKDFLGIIALMDTPRKEAKNVIAQLKELGIKKMVMLTGDNQQVAEAVAKEVGVTDAWGNLMPEDKVAAVQKLDKSEKKVAMVGDGVNDAPAMAKSTVGIAMGAAGSDVALETADIALMGDQLESLPFAIGLSRKSRGIIKQNLCISLGMVAVLIPLTILGIASIGPAVIAHEGSTLLVVFNALRLLAYDSGHHNSAKSKKKKDA